MCPSVKRFDLKRLCSNVKINIWKKNKNPTDPTQDRSCEGKQKIIFWSKLLSICSHNVIYNSATSSVIEKILNNENTLDMSDVPETRYPGLKVWNRRKGITSSTANNVKKYTCKIYQGNSVWVSILTYD